MQRRNYNVNCEIIIFTNSFLLKVSYKFDVSIALFINAHSHSHSSSAKRKIILFLIIREVISTSMAKFSFIDISNQAKNGVKLSSSNN